MSAAASRRFEHAHAAPFFGPFAGARLQTLFLVAAVGAAAVHPLARTFAAWSRPLDLVTHFQAEALVVSAAAAALALRLQARRLAAGLALLAVLQVGPLVRYDGPNPVTPRPDAKPVRILVANVLHRNEEYHALADLIRHERPDIVGLVEYSEAWLAGLEADGVRREFPHRRELPASARGMALWFREPPESMSGFEVAGPDGNPTVSARFRLGGELRSIRLVHPPNPLSEPDRADVDLVALGRLIGRESGSRIVVGDLNRTDGSPHFSTFLRSTGLRDSRHGFGVQATFPSELPVRIAIDHAFLSDDIAVVDRRVGPNIGSDHLPLILDVAPASSTARASASASAAGSAGPSASSPANLVRSAAAKSPMIRSDVAEPTSAGRTGSAPISSVVFAAQAGPNRATRAVLTDSAARTTAGRGPSGSTLGTDAAAAGGRRR